jgi:hypothetical protein
MLFIISFAKYLIPLETDSRFSETSLPSFQASVFMDLWFIKPSRSLRTLTLFISMLTIQHHSQKASRMNHYHMSTSCSHMGRHAFVPSSLFFISMHG